MCVELNYYELSGMNYTGFLYTHDSLLPTHKVLKNLAKIIKAHGLENSTIQTVYTVGSTASDDEFVTTIIVGGAY